MGVNYMVFDVPATDSGPLSILNDFYWQVRKNPDQSVHWYFVISTPPLEDAENITVIRRPAVKKSWLHRLWFDHFSAKKLVRDYQIDKVLSLQNVTISAGHRPQLLYIHQSLPFDEYRFSLARKEERLLWVHQNIIGRKILKSVHKADKVVVQTQWMKQACLHKTKVNEEKVAVIAPQVDSAHLYPLQPCTSQGCTRFFYPSTALFYKNHRVIIEACKKLKQMGYIDYTVTFTLEPGQNSYVCGLQQDSIPVKQNIIFGGRLSREQVFERYADSVLLFASFIETFGLPLLEARLTGTRVIASDKLYSHEILDDYPNASFFSASDSDALAAQMKDVMENRLKHSESLRPEQDCSVSLIRQLQEL